MKKLILLICLMIVTPVYGWMSTAIIGGGVPAASTSTVYNYGGSNATSDGYSSEYQFGNTDAQIGDDVSISQSGTITSIGVKMGVSNTGSSNLRIGVYYDNSGTWTLHECVTVAMSGTGWVDAPLTTGLSVSASDIVWVIVSNESSGIYYTHERTTGGHYRSAQSYANACVSTITISDEWEYGVRVEVTY